MTLFMDTHSLDGGVKASDVSQGHLADLGTQDRHGVHYLRYWVDEGAGKIFCLVDAPDADAAIRVHREAHGLVAEHQSGDRRGMMNRRMTRFAAAPIATILLGAGMIGSAAARSDLQTGKAATSRFGIPPFFGLHVWLFQDNPSGMFAPYNPNVTCDNASASTTGSKTASGAFATLTAAIAPRSLCRSKGTTA